MDKAKVKEVADTWMIPTPGAAYMAGLETRPVLATASGSTVVDTAGREYLDFQSGQMGAALGHRHPRVMAAIEKATCTIVHASNTMMNVPRLLLHERLGRLLAPPLQKSLFLVSGSDSIEASVDLARNATGGHDVLGLHEALHGSTSLVSRSLSFGWGRSQHAAVAPGTAAILAPDCYRCPVAATYPQCDFLCLKTSLSLADANFTARPAAIIAEPVLSAGGVIVPPPGYFGALRRACEERGMLLIFDEAQTGLGKTGKTFCYEHEDVVPDILALSKHFGGGLPISAVCTSAAIADRAVDRGFFATRSHATDPILCAAGLASIDVVVEEDMAGRAACIERRIKTAFREMAEKFEIIGDIRGRGVLLGVELVTDRAGKAPANKEASAITRHCQDNGLIFQVRGSHGRMNVLRLVPPMVTTDAEVERALSILHDAFAAVCGAA
ncbi:MAG TPA: aminotransferase class III-fold pyridoxal phosphate-dependent enzyme [Candidatus Methylomirabilis sp.]|nr:aminotransferase class III-fold pyridoxal phosphate-dependent enzyme [Candidatus Methylomirabilis sp.]